MKTRDEVAYLKANWQADPCWDLETTEGFEEYKDELKAFSDSVILQAKVCELDRIQRKATALEISTSLARYIVTLEDRFLALEDKIDKLDRARLMQGRIGNC